MKHEIKVQYFNSNTKEIEETIISDYGIVQAINEVRFIHDFKIMVLSASFINIDKVIDDIK